jgi:hypothetical protein
MLRSPLACQTLSGVGQRFSGGKKGALHKAETQELSLTFAPYAAMAVPVISRQIWNFFPIS